MAAENEQKILVASSDPNELVMQFTEAAVQRGGTPDSARQEFDQQALEELATGLREDRNFLQRFGDLLSTILRP